MKINQVQNYSTYKNTNPQFKGYVSPEFVRYVNGVREDCLQTVPKHSTNLINNVCNGLLEKSNEIMKKCFPPTSVLSVDTKDKTIVFGIEDGILKKYGGGLIGSNFIKEYFPPSEKLKMLQLIIKNKTNNVFVDALAKHLMGIGGLGYTLAECNNYNKYNEGYSDLEYLLKWWDEHLGFLPLDFKRFSELKIFINNVMSNLKEHREELMQNRPQIKSKKHEELKTTTDNLFEHLRETVSMPSKDVIYDGRKTEREMEKLIDELVPPVLKDVQAGKIDKKNIKSASSDLYKYHIYKIEGTKNCYRGPLEYSDIDILKPLGLKEIDIRFATKGPFTEYIDEIIDFIKSMQGDSVYLGCMNGTKRTNRAVTLDYYLNPLQKHKEAGGFSLGDYDDILDLCDEFTPEQKKEMQWTEEFEKELRAKIDRDKEFFINN